ncbi:MAG TPA: radical SAM protein [Anaeromyxobacteraceae bacterium]|nr:radical SAM protein [Anaeromyxobacteraceae bacterium]
MSSSALAVVRDGARPGATVPFRWLDALWIQVTGTLCNLACRHCFISCGPKADQVPMMSVQEVQRALDEGRRQGVRQVYFTGGEPFLHPRIADLVQRALAVAPLTIATNGVLLDEPAVAWVRRAFDRAPYSLDLRISLDGMTAAQNDRVRGRGTFARITAALRRLGAAGLSPVVTVVEHEDGLAGSRARSDFLDFLRGLGLRQPRVKFLPLLRTGREERRTHGYDDPTALSDAPLPPGVEDALLCASGRCVTAHGAFPCPILVDRPDALLGATLAEAAGPLRLRWSACQTCVLDGLRCNT